MRVIVEQWGVSLAPDERSCEVSCGGIAVVNADGSVTITFPASCVEHRGEIDNGSAYDSRDEEIMALAVAANIVDIAFVDKSIQDDVATQVSVDASASKVK